MTIPSSFREFTDNLRATADIVEVAGGYIELKRTGSNYKACCPFHQEKTPSCIFNPARQFFKCYGCGKGGDVIRFVQEIERVEFREALEILAKQYNLEVPRFKGRAQPDDEAVQRRETLEQALEESARFFMAQLKNPETGAFARRYLTERRIPEEQWAAFSLGYAPDNWDQLLTHLTSKGFSRQSMEDAGVVQRRKSGQGHYDYLRHRLIFPIHNSRGKVVAFGGRVFDNSEPKYLNTAETELFRKGHELYGLHQAREMLTREGRPALLVEGYLDVMAAQQAGLPGMAPMGTALTPDQARLLKRFSQQVVFLFDADDSGQKAIERGIPVLLAAGLEVAVGQMPAGEDPDSVIREGGPEALQKVVDEAPGFFEFLMARARQHFGLESPEARLKAVELFKAALLAIPEELVREGYIQRLALELQLEEAALRRFLFREADRQAAWLQPEQEAEPVAALTGAGAPTRLELGLMHLLLDHEDARAAARERLQQEWISHPLVRYFVFRLLEMEVTAGQASWQLVEECGDPEQQKWLEERITESGEDVGEDYLSVLDSLLDRLEVRFFRAENQRLNPLLREAEQSGDQENLASINAVKLQNLRAFTERRKRVMEQNPSTQVRYDREG